MQLESVFKLTYQYHFYCAQLSFHIDRKVRTKLKYSSKCVKIQPFTMQIYALLWWLMYFPFASLLIYK